MRHWVPICFGLTDETLGVNLYSVGHSYYFRFI
ncbi:hypothetical protein F383_15235 [Gossypium arboreum]|uniref:Uncharacterized protein n=1 Tax=Gossypium arboreum TaxID=29729 RepID=A0A0B0PSL2_GOSAR|nr:hypothetical protein F383_15235 [Gossypium arboreum]